MSFLSDMWDGAVEKAGEVKDWVGNEIDYAENKGKELYNDVSSGFQAAQEVKHASDEQLYNNVSNAAESVGNAIENEITPQPRPDQSFVDGFGDFVSGFRAWKYKKDHPILSAIKEGTQNVSQEYADANRAEAQGGAKVVADVGNSIANYGVGAVQGFQEMSREENRFNTVAMYDSATGKYVPKPGYSQEDVDTAQGLVDKANYNFRNETIYPGVMAAGVAAAPFTAGGSLAAEAAFGLQAGEGLYKGAQEATQQGYGPVASLGLGVKSIWLDPLLNTVNAPDFQQKLAEHPAATIANVVMGGVNVAVPIFGAYGGLKGFKTKGKGESGDSATNETTAGEAERPTIVPPGEMDPPPPVYSPATQSAVSGFGEWRKRNEATAAGGDQIIATGEQQLGKPYQLGGDGTDTTDCGKFTQDVYAANGIELNTRRADLQYQGLEEQGKTFDDPSQLQPGDLVFFKNTYDDDTGYKSITHVGIYAGDGKMLHAGSHGVGYTDLNTDYWQSKIAGFGRALDGEKIGLEKSPITVEKDDTDTSTLPEEENQPEATPDSDTTTLDHQPQTISETIEPHEQEFIDQAKENSWDINQIENDIKTQYDEIVNDHVNFLEKSLENGGVEKRSMTPSETSDSGYVFNPTISNNPTWYREYYKTYGKRPSKSELREIAIDQLKNGFRDDLYGEVPPTEHFNEVESALNGIKSIKEKIARASEKERASRASEKGNRNIQKEKINNEEPPTYIDKDLTTKLGEGEQGSLGTPKTASGNGKVTPITRAEINKAVDDLVASRTGKIGNKNYAGVFKVDKDVIRSANFGDFDTIAHEVGHYLDKQLKITGHDSELITAADRIWGRNKLYKKYTPDQRRAEGIAEFSRQYLTDQQKAKQNFPGYYNDFTAALAKDGKLSKKVGSIGDKMQRWFNQSAEARGRGSVTFGNDKSSFETIKDTARNAAYKAYETFFDDKSELSRLTDAIQKQIGHDLEFEKNPYKRARMAQTSALARAEMLVSDDNPGLVRDTLNKLYHGKLQYDVTMKDIFDFLGDSRLQEKYPDYLERGNFKSWQQAYSTLLAARRQIELQALEPEYKGPLTKTDAAEIMKNAPKELQDLAQKFYQYNDNLLAIAQDGGLISQGTINTLRDKYSNYAPMMRDFDDEAAMTDAFSSNGKKIGNVSNPLKKLTEEGSTRSVIDPIESTIKNTFILLDAVERNKVAQTFVDLEKNSGIGRFIEKVPGETADAKKSIFTVMVDGKKQAYQTTPEFYRAIMSMNQASSNMLISFLKPFAQALRVGATISPDFVVRNLIRDTLTAGIYSETGFKPVLDSAKGVYSLIKDKPLSYEFKASGAPLSAFVGLDRKGVSRLINEMGEGSKWRKVNPLTYVRAAYDGLREVSEYGESGTRIREFERARQQGKSIDEAGLLAKDVTLDFSRSGTLTKQINQVVPFFNAALQGGDRFVRSLKDNPKRTIPLAMMYITLPSVVTWVMNHDKDWYKELSDDIKNGCWLFESNGTIIRIPKPFEPGIFFGSAIERALDKAYGEDPDAVKKWASYAAQGFAPNVIPTLVGPILEWMTNYSFFTNKSVVGRKEQRLPDEYQFNDYTSEAAKKLGKTTGLSPEKIDNTINGYLGSAGKFFVGLGDTFIGDKKEMPAKTTAELPGIRGLTYTEFKNPNSVNEFYEKLDEAEKNHAATGKKGIVPADLKKLRKVEQKMKELQKANLDITSNKELTAEQKRQKIDANKSQILQLAKNVLGKN